MKAPFTALALAGAAALLSTPAVAQPLNAQAAEIRTAKRAENPVTILCSGYIVALPQTSLQPTTCLDKSAQLVNVGEACQEVSVTRQLDGAIDVAPTGTIALSWFFVNTENRNIVESSRAYPAQSGFIWDGGNNALGYKLGDEESFRWNVQQAASPATSLLVTAEKGVWRLRCV